ncbi:unnamed protein product [Ambrosiozyma monospora]|uniref:Unnamed protein product n=1 Tax=Ambrosiozyma monospora TaxID=43982 RepID=A0ACB5TWN1_AMBMO|nr:unnamed protein product [Ambrosiozyma monospora]
MGNDINQGLTKLTNLISNNRDILTASIDISRCLPTPLITGVFQGLLNVCDSVRTHQIIVNSESLNDINWVKGMVCPDELTIMFPQNPDLSLDLLSPNLHLLKYLRLLGFVNASFFNMIPDTLESFQLDMRKFNSSTIKLPSKLKMLVIESGVDSYVSHVDYCCVYNDVDWLGLSSRLFRGIMIHTRGKTMLAIHCLPL